MRDGDIAYRILRLEEQLESYRKLHAEEIDELRKGLLEIRQHILSTDPGESDTSQKSDALQIDSDGLPVGYQQRGASIIRSG